jgi:uncharacterized protein with ParB-like and HNH nuclease domain
MDRYKTINTFIAEMEEKYQPDSKFKERIAPFIDMLNDSKISDNDFDNLLTLVENTYKRHIELEENRKISQEGVIEIGNNLKKIEELYGQQMKGVIDITKKCEKIKDDMDTLILLTTKPKGEA